MLIGLITFSGGWHIPEEILSGTFRGTYNFSNPVTFQNETKFNSFITPTHFERFDLRGAASNKIRIGYLELSTYGNLLCHRVLFETNDTIINDENILLIENSGNYFKDISKENLILFNAYILNKERNKTPVFLSFQKGAGSDYISLNSDTNDLLKNSEIFSNGCVDLSLSSLVLWNYDYSVFD